VATQWAPSGAAAASASASRAHSSSAAPSRASRRAVASPIPREAPVTRQRLSASPRSIALLRLPQLQHRQERLLRHLHAPDLLLGFLAAFLFPNRLALRVDLPALAFGDDILAVRLARFARDDARADRRLDRDVELLARDPLAQLLDERAPDLLGLGA